MEAAVNQRRSNAIVIVIVIPSPTLVDEAAANRRSCSEPAKLQRPVIQLRVRGCRDAQKLAEARRRWREANRGESVVDRGERERGKPGRERLIVRESRGERREKEKKGERES